MGERPAGAARESGFGESKFKRFTLITRLIEELRPSSLVVISPFMDVKAVEFLERLMRVVGTRVVVFTRAPEGGRGSELVERLRRLEESGAVVVFDYSRKLHEKAIYVDGRFKIFGSVNFASWSDERMESVYIAASPGDVDVIRSKLRDLGVKLNVYEDDSLLAQLQRDLFIIIRNKSAK